MTTSTSLNLAQSDGALSSQQLSLPTGPLGLVRPRRERTGEDREWYSKQLSVQHVKHWDKVVYERVAYYASLNPGRLAFPSVARVAREALCSNRTVQRALRRLESGGLLKCVAGDKGGRGTAQYLVVGQRVMAGVTESHGRGDRESPEVIREGRRVSTKNTSLSAVAHILDPVKPERPQEQAVLLTVPFPSRKQEQKQEKAPLPKAQEPAFQHPKQVGMLCSVARKLNYALSDEEALTFDAMEHAGRKAILDRLLAEEQDKALHGEVAPPPKKPRSPRDEVAVERKPKPDRPSCVEHSWTPPASDGISNCVNCDEERPGI